MDSEGFKGGGGVVDPFEWAIIEYCAHLGFKFRASDIVGWLITRGRASLDEKPELLKQVHSAIKRLVDRGFARKLGRGLYEFTPKIEELSDGRVRFDFGINMLEGLGQVIVRYDCKDIPGRGLKCGDWLVWKAPKELIEKLDPEEVKRIYVDKVIPAAITLLSLMGSTFKDEDLRRRFKQFSRQLMTLYLQIKGEIPPEPNPANM